GRYIPIASTISGHRNPIHISKNSTTKSCHSRQNYWRSPLPLLRTPRSSLRIQAGTQNLPSVWETYLLRRVTNGATDSPDNCTPPSRMQIFLCLGALDEGRSKIKMGTQEFTSPDDLK